MKHKSYARPNYGFRLSWSNEDAEFVATCVEIDGVSGLGATKSAALAESEKALDLVLADFASEGIALPPVQPPVEHSGQFRVRLPRELHSKLVRRADEEAVSLNALVLSYVSMGLGDAEARTQSIRAVRELVQELYTAVQVQNLSQTQGTLPFR